MSIGVTEFAIFCRLSRVGKVGMEERTASPDSAFGRKRSFLCVLIPKATSVLEKINPKAEQKNKNIKNKMPKMEKYICETY